MHREAGNLAKGSRSEAGVQCTPLASLLHRHWIRLYGHISGYFRPV